MIKLVKGTIETVPVDLTDRLGNLTDLAGHNVSFAIRLRSGTEWLVEAETVFSTDGMRALCLIDTTGSDWVVGVYELFMIFSNGAETPRIGPMEFEVAYGMPEG